MFLKNLKRSFWNTLWVVFFSCWKRLCCFFLVYFSEPKTIGFIMFFLPFWLFFGFCLFAKLLFFFVMGKSKISNLQVSKIALFTTKQVTNKITIHHPRQESGCHQRIRQFGLGRLEQPPRLEFGWRKRQASTFFRGWKRVDGSEIRRSSWYTSQSWLWFLNRVSYMSGGAGFLHTMSGGATPPPWNEQQSPLKIGSASMQISGALLFVSGRRPVFCVFVGDRPVILQSPCSFCRTCRMPFFPKSMTYILYISQYLLQMFLWGSLNLLSAFPWMAMFFLGGWLLSTQ